MKCPNCQEEAKEIPGNKLFCGKCNTTFKLAPDGSARADQVDVLKDTQEKISDHDKRIAKLEIGKPRTEQPADPEAQADEIETDPDGCESNLFPE